jgi:hypothetical protein
MRRERKSKEETQKIKDKIAFAFKQKNSLKSMETEELEVLLLQITGELEARQGTSQARQGLIGSTRSLRRFYSGLYEE